MMNHTFISENTNTLMHTMYPAIVEHGVLEKTRNGPVRRFAGHTTITITNPRRRVNFSPARDANPFFHIIESVAMLGNFNSVELLSYFAKNMANFSDDGKVFNAFYGTRARKYNDYYDQLKQVCYNLADDPTSRREVISLVDPYDLSKTTKDKACNLSMVFYVNQTTGAVDMSTFNRSNDMVWGFVTGANIVHFSYFQEYVAAALRRNVGLWHHTSCNMHQYCNPQADKIINALAQEKKDGWCDYYENYLPNSEYKQQLIFKGGLLEADRFTDQCSKACYEMREANRYRRLANVFPFGEYSNTWLRETVHPIYNSFQARRLGKPQNTIRYYLNKIQEPDWREACTNWVNRRDT